MAEDGLGLYFLRKCPSLDRVAGIERLISCDGFCKLSSSRVRLFIPSLLSKFQKFRGIFIQSNHALSECKLILEQ